jgi:hypothetical protein
MAALEKSCGRPPTSPAAWIHQIHTAGGANGPTMVMLFVMLFVLFVPLFVLFVPSRLVVILSYVDKYERITLGRVIDVTKCPTQACIILADKDNVFMHLGVSGIMSGSSISAPVSTGILNNGQKEIPQCFQRQVQMYYHPSGIHSFCQLCHPHLCGMADDLFLWQFLCHGWRCANS